VSGGARVLLEEAVEAQFLFDTGATRTLVSADIASELNLPTDGQPIEVLVAGRNRALFLRAKVCLCIGSNWHEVDCYVPYPVDVTRPTRNLLGMDGLLADHLFCLGYDELHLFRRLAPNGP
jgi:predicted aspartyl protease